MENEHRTTPHIAVVLTSHGNLGTTGERTGFCFEEMSTPYYTFVEAGCDVTLVSIAGGEPPYDPASLSEDVMQRPDSVRRFLDDKEAMEKLRSTLSVADVTVGDFDAIFLAGGHGTMWDMPENDTLGRLVGRIEQQGRLIGAVCHGPAGLLSATDDLGRSLLKARRMAAFTNEEEEQVGLDNTVPFLLESRLKERGATIQKTDSFQIEVAQDERVITGQNPASAGPTADKMVAELFSMANFTNAT